MRTIYWDSWAIGYATLSRPVFDLATDLRARYRLKTADAMHLAAAIIYGCDEFWTNDRRLDQAAAGHIQTVSIEQLP
ncbi:PIN domain-containing protein [uncultured Thiodictyon sp.]|uniref:type II toxin-antitoxin system VapC family toxin n=1 Tax=uncultured Thiodictyon sp. TaxID=1846217 RepID=UPI0025DC9C1D|nr:PIN domain-containing protein [uncultured Thiodictyon sp.]